VCGNAVCVGSMFGYVDFCTMVFLADMCGWLREVTSDKIIKSDVKELKVRVMVFLSKEVAYEGY
jgi:hypothetical protein